MKKVLMAIFILMSLGNATNTYFENSSGHSDNIYGIYNDSCIETVNYLFLFYSFPEGESYIEEDIDIWVENITEIGDKAFKADIYYLD